MATNRQSLPGVHPNNTLTMRRQGLSSAQVTSPHAWGHQKLNRIKETVFNVDGFKISTFGPILPNIQQSSNEFLDWRRPLWLQTRSLSFVRSWRLQILVTCVRHPADHYNWELTCRVPAQSGNESPVCRGQPYQPGSVRKNVGLKRTKQIFLSFWWRCK